MSTFAFYDTQPYDLEYFERAPEGNRLHRQFHEFRLTSETAASVAFAAFAFVAVELEKWLRFGRGRGEHAIPG